MTEQLFVFGTAFFFHYLSDEVTIEIEEDNRMMLDLYLYNV